MELNAHTAFDVNVADIQGNEQASDIFDALFAFGEDNNLLSDADSEFEVAGNQDLPNVLEISAHNADRAGNQDGGRIFTLMAEIVRRFPQADYSA